MQSCFDVASFYAFLYINDERVIMLTWMGKKLRNKRTKKKLFILLYFILYFMFFVECTSPWFWWRFIGSVIFIGGMIYANLVQWNYIDLPCVVENRIFQAFFCGFHKQQIISKGKHLCIKDYFEAKVLVILEFMAPESGKIVARTNKVDDATCLDRNSFQTLICLFYKIVSTK